MRVSAIIPAAGLSKRMKGFAKRKPFILLNRKPVVSYVLNAFKEMPSIKEIILVVNKKDLNTAKGHFNGIKIIAGGLERRDSVYNGIKAASRNSDIILIHDGVRPFVSKGIILNVIKAAEMFGAAVVAVPVIPTIKRVDEKGFVVSTLNRSVLWEIQTPQVFRREIIMKAYANVGADLKHAPTDDAMLVEKLGYRVKIVMGSYDNIKITTPKDLAVAEAMLCA